MSGLVLSLIVQSIVMHKAYNKLYRIKIVSIFVENLSGLVYIVFLSYMIYLLPSKFTFLMLYRKDPVQPI